MKKSIMGPSAFVISFVIRLYTAFVAKSFWNWFVSPIFPISEITFLNMCGLFLLISLFRNVDYGSELHWEKLFRIIDIYLPESKQEAVKEYLIDFEENIWVLASSKILIQFLSTTFVFVVGWIVHYFLI